LSELLLQLKWNY